MLKKFLIEYKITILTAVVIFILSTVSFSSSATSIPIKHFDKLVHLIMYFFLAFVFYKDYTHNRVFDHKKYHFFLLFLYPLLYGGFIEIIQEYCTQNRGAEWLDWLADGVGVLLGLLVYHWLKKKKR